MRITDDMRRCVVFFGYEDVTLGKGGIDCIGTGFLLEHEGLGYLVTAQHLAHQLGQDPFLLRVNKLDGSSENVHVDGADWLIHPDETVDLAATPIFLDPREGYDSIYLGGETLELTREQLITENIGIGDFTYTVGLFRLMSGEKRNLPVCHFGTISLFPGDEKIPTLDWRDVSQRTVIHAEGFLVESQSLSGLSGSPVFTRSETMFDPSSLHLTVPPSRPLESRKVLWPRVQLRLLGLWAGSWTLPPDQVKAIQSKSSAGSQVPLGMGVVVPCFKIVELLDLPHVKDMRNEMIKKFQPNAINLDSLRNSSFPSTQGADDPEREEADPLTIQSAILCDGLRPEPNGQKTLVGIFGTIVFFSSIPDSAAATLFMKVNGKPGIRRLTFRVVDENNNQLREDFESLMRVDEHSTNAEISVASVKYRLGKPLTVIFQLKQLGGDWQDIVSYRVTNFPGPL